MFGLVRIDTSQATPVSQVYIDEFWLYDADDTDHDFIEDGLLQSSQTAFTFDSPGVYSYGDYLGWTSPVVPTVLSLTPTSELIAAIGSTANLCIDIRLSWPWPEDPPTVLGGNLIEVWVEGVQLAIDYEDDGYWEEDNGVYTLWAYATFSNTPEPTTPMGWIDATEWTLAYGDLQDDPPWDDPSPVYAECLPIAQEGGGWSWTGGENAGGSLFFPAGTWANGLRPTKIRLTHNGNCGSFKLYSSSYTISNNWTLLYSPTATEYDVTVDNDINALVFYFGHEGAVLSKIEFYIPEPDAPNRLYKLGSTLREDVWVPDPVIPNPITNGGGGSTTVIPPGGAVGWGSSSNPSSGGKPPTSGGGDSDGNSDNLPSLAEALKIIEESGGEIDGVQIDPNAP